MYTSNNINTNGNVCVDLGGYASNLGIDFLRPTMNGSVMNNGWYMNPYQSNTMDNTSTGIVTTVTNISNDADTVPPAHVDSPKAVDIGITSDLFSNMNTVEKSSNDGRNYRQVINNIASTSTVPVLNKRWYFLLNSRNKGDDDTKPEKKNKMKGLLDDYSISDVRKKLLVAIPPKSLLDDELKSEFLFTIFDSYIEFGKYQLNIPESRRGFFELILDGFQKPHFDIDINITEHDVDTDKIRDIVVESIITVLKEKEVTLDLTRDILIFTSHGAKKRSYHIIIDHYCHIDNDDAKGFYDAVVEKFKQILPISYYEQVHLLTKPELISKWIDHNVYKSKQQFRIVGSQKPGSGRKKEFNAVWYYYGKEIRYVYPEAIESETHQMMLELEASLVSNTVKCALLPPFVEDKNNGSNGVINKESLNLTVTDAREALFKLGQFIGMSPNNNDFPFRLRKNNEINDNCVILRRVKPSRCTLCNRIHESENPFIFIYGKERKLYFDCRRNSAGKRIYFGKLGLKDEETKGVNVDTGSGSVDTGSGSGSDETMDVDELNDIRESADFYAHNSQVTPVPQTIQVQPILSDNTAARSSVKHLAGVPINDPEIGKVVTKRKTKSANYRQAQNAQIQSSLLKDVFCGIRK